MVASFSARPRHTHMSTTRPPPFGYHEGEYRVNAGYFRSDGEGDSFRALGAVVPYVSVAGRAGTPEGDVALSGFLEARRHAGFRFTLGTGRLDARRVRIEWSCRPTGEGDAHADVRDVEGAIECGAWYSPPRRSGHGGERGII